MVVQYTKFLKMGLESKWRGPVAALTYIETSTWTRQGEFGRWCRKNAGRTDVDQPLGVQSTTVSPTRLRALSRLSSRSRRTSLASTSRPTPTRVSASLRTASAARTVRLHCYLLDWLKPTSLTWFHANRRQLDRRNQGSVADLPDQGGSRGIVCRRRHDLGE